jgi:hypothetical protein
VIVEKTDSTTVRPERIIVTDKDTIMSLFDNRQRGMLGPFFQGPTSIADAAKQTNSLPTTMLYFVRRMEKAGVLMKHDKVRSTGKSVARYMTCADELYIPVDAAEDLMVVPERRYQTLYNEAFVHEIVSHHHEVEPLGARIRCLKNGSVDLTGNLLHGDFVPGENGPLVVFEWSTLKLDEPQAREFQAELFALIKRYRALPLGKKTFYFGLHLAPAPSHHKNSLETQIGNASYTSQPTTPKGLPTPIECCNKAAIAEMNSRR